MRSRDESRHGSCHPDLAPAMPGESIEAVASRHESSFFKLPQRGKEGTVTHLPGESGWVRVTHHQSKQLRLRHVSP
jgi:hypothetical protein